MSLERVSAFDPLLMDPTPPRSGRRRSAGAFGRGLGRRLLAFVGRHEGHAFVAKLCSARGVSGVVEGLRGVLGDGFGTLVSGEDRVAKPEAFLLWIHLPGDLARAARVDEPSPVLARLVREGRTSIVPVHVERIAKRRLRATLGAPIPGSRLSKISTARELFRFLGQRCAALEHRSRTRAAPAGALVGAAPVADAISTDLVEREIRALPRDQQLVESGRFVVVQAHEHQIPACVREVGRLREITFRAAGEGTGRSLDLDACDRSYRHLLLFDREASVIAGAYRFAPTDEIVPVFGVEGLYTSTLFRIDPRLFEALGPSLELGRSFVRLEYQRGYAPLLLLWRGLSAFVAANPRYRILFGAVSVSATYAAFSRELLATVLGRPPALHPLASFVEPRNPLRPRRGVRSALDRFGASIEDASDLAAIVSDVEADAKGLPVLLREYLKLGGRLLGWSVDRTFASALDGLIAVDLPHADPRLLGLYMGREAAEAYCHHHGVAG